jgi:hypothetical protein
LPCECAVCGLTLVAAPHLARSAHHLAPVAAYDVVGERTSGTTATEDAHKDEEERKDSDAATDAAVEAPSEGVSCRACGRALPPTLSLQLRCPLCQWVFCIECDEFIHSQLHNCPGCTSSSSGATAVPASAAASAAGTIKQSPDATAAASNAASTAAASQKANAIVNVKMQDAAS